MALLELNGYGVVRGVHSLPLSGAWHADLFVDVTDASKVTGKVTLSVEDGAATFSGSSVFAGPYLDTTHVRIVAGSGGLAKPATPKFYQRVTVKIVLNDLLAAGGESLSTSADAATLATQLDNWTVSQTTIGNAIVTLMGEVGASWRFQPDGTLWCGKETWPDAGIDYSLEASDPANQQIRISSEAPSLLPGTSLDGSHICYVEHEIKPGSIFSTGWIGDTDRVKAPLLSLARGAFPAIDFLALYDATVVKQSDDLATVDANPLDPRLPSMAGIPLRLGLPGCAVQVSPGAIVRIGWDRGDPGRPFASLWQGGETVIKLNVNAQSIVLAGGTLGVARQSDPISSATAGPYAVSPQVIQTGSTKVLSG